VHENVVQIIREEMDAIGGQEMLMPVLTPIELWQHTKRDHIQELFRLKDRNGRDYVLPMTHEETVTWTAKEIQSYRQLPQILYHFSIKERDEPRPSGGLLRLREFIMKDSYSFDRDEEGLDVSFRKHADAYERIFERCGVEAYAVDAEPGMMGGKESVDYLAPSGSGQNTLVTCERGDYAADLEVARGVPRAPEFPARLDAPAEVETPGIGTIEELAGFLGIDAAATSKAMPVVTDGRVVLALVRGDDRVEEGKLASVLGAPFRPATAEEILEEFGADPGSLGPVGFSGQVVADRTGWHLRGVEAGRDFEAQFVDIRQPLEGDACPNCGGALRFQTAIEVGHIFKFGTRYSEPLGATFLDEDGRQKPLVGGSYGIGPGRVMAAVIEQHHDEHGIRWPRSIAPYVAHVVTLPGTDEPAAAAEAALVERLGERHVLVDDRDLRAGEKFADADLIGCPIRVTVGKRSLEDGAVDVRSRETGEDRRVPIAELGTVL
jgi:prolyl-tRNA synthetase